MPSLPTVDDRWLWLGLGVFTFAAVRAVSYGLSNVVTLTEVTTPANYKPPTIPPPIQGRRVKEDAIKTSSLQVLATCDNVDIRRSATQILCDRFAAHKGSEKQLLRDLRSPNPHVKRRARLALKLLRRHGVPVMAERLIAPRPPPPPPVTLLLPARSTTATRRGIIWSTANQSIRRRQTSGQDATQQERALRRRRREAMVINEGDRPVSQEDVWMRDDAGRMNRVNGELRLTLPAAGSRRRTTTGWSTRNRRATHHRSSRQTVEVDVPSNSEMPPSEVLDQLEREVREDTPSPESSTPNV